jgi:hypothetical protein
MRMAERRILDREVQEVILSADTEVVEEYLKDKYSPSCLLLGYTSAGRALHVQATHAGVIVTVYEPSPDEWVNLRKRRQR